MERLRTDCPNNRASPVVGRAMVRAIFTRVVFPAPFGPSNPKIVPGSTAKLTESRACTCSLWLHHRRNVFDTEIASNAGDMASDYSAPTNVMISAEPLAGLSILCSDAQEVVTNFSASPAES